MVITNISVYKAIADETHQKMHELMDAGRQPKPDGSDGWVITFDPSQRSFKQSMIAIVFTGMWLEALMHLLIVCDYGEQKFKEYDFKSYEEKLQLLGFSDQEIIDRVTRFRSIRKALVHEKRILMMMKLGGHKMKQTMPTRFLLHFTTNFHQNRANNRLESDGLPIRCAPGQSAAQAKR